MTNEVVTTALKAIANEPEAALSGAVAKSVETSSGWLETLTNWVGAADDFVQVLVVQFKHFLIHGDVLPSVYWVVTRL